MSSKEFGIKLKKARQEKQISQRSLGLSLGLSDKTISSYESHRSFPNLEVLRKISDILDKPIEYFVSSSKDIVIRDYLVGIEKRQEELINEIRELTSLIKKVE